LQLIFSESEPTIPDWHAQEIVIKDNEFFDMENKPDLMPSFKVLGILQVTI